MTIEVVPRRYDDQGGGLALVDGKKMQIVEHGELSLSFCNTGTVWLEVDRISEQLLLQHAPATSILLREVTQRKHLGERQLKQKKKSHFLILRWQGTSSRCRLRSASAIGALHLLLCCQHDLWPSISGADSS